MNDLALFDELRTTQIETSRVELTLAERGAAATTFLGLALFVATFFVEVARPGTIQSLGWIAPLVVGGITIGGSLAWSFVSYSSTHTGIRHDRVFFDPLSRRGATTLMLALSITSFYCVLYWWGDKTPSAWTQVTVAALGALVIAYGAYAFKGTDAKRRKSILTFLTGLVVTGAFTALYWWDGHQVQGIDPLAGGVALVDPLSQVLAGKAADKWFLYGTMYTTAVLVMGVRMFWKYRHNRYHLVRTASVMWFQLAFAFLLPNLLKSLHQPDFYFTYFWPLKPEYLLPFSVGWTLDGGSLGRAMILWSVLASFVGVPVLTYYFGKRWYCSWVCGCGGLSETLGDPWRQLSDKSEGAWKLERITIHSVLLMIVLITIGLWAHEILDLQWLSESGKNWYYKWYGFFIASVLSGVVGTGFYPVLGSRTWCRFGCPQAALLGLLQRFFSRFRITTNGAQCISCGNCSTFCEMGIDVRSYAQRGVNIVRASCVGCGVCAAVCPRGVLKLENGPRGDRFDGADDPITDLLQALGVKTRA